MNNPIIAMIAVGIAVFGTAFLAYEVFMNAAARNSGYALAVYRCLDNPCSTERLERMINDLNADAKETGTGPNHRLAAMTAGYAAGMVDAVASNGK